MIVKHGDAAQRPEEQSPGSWDSSATETRRAGTGADSTITSDASTEIVSLSKDLDVSDGYFGADTIIVGDQSIGEDGELTISDPITPGITIKDSGDAGNDARAFLKIVDMNDATIYALEISANKHAHLTSQGAFTIGTEAVETVSIVGNKVRLVGTTIEIDENMSIEDLIE